MDALGINMFARMLPVMDTLIAYNGHARMDATGMNTFVTMLPGKDTLIAEFGHAKMDALWTNNIVCMLQPIITINILLIGLTSKFELLFF